MDQSYGNKKFTHRLMVLPLRIWVFIQLILFPALGFSQGSDPEISFQQDVHDFGTIKEATGIVHTTFPFVNSGNTNLEIKKVQAGCGCTGADWTRGQILPGDSGLVKISFDPTGKPGAFLKNIIVVSNAINSPKTLVIKGKVVPKPTDYSDTFRFSYGSLLATSNHLVFPEIWPGLTKEDTLRFLNKSYDTIRWELKAIPGFMSAQPAAGIIPPNGRGYLMISLDPSKSSLQGEWSEKLVIETNDDLQSEKIFMLSGKILDKQPTPTLEQLFPVQLGSLMFSKNTLVFRNVLNTSIQTDTLLIYNSATYPIHILIKEKPEPVISVISSLTIQPGDSARLILGFDGKKASVYGYASYGMIFLESNDSVQPNTVVHVSAEISEDFSHLNKRKKAKAPVAQFSFTDFDFGSAIQGSPVRLQFPVANHGHNNLIIRRIQTPMGINAICLPGDTVYPGATAVIDVEFPTLHKVGYQTSEITVITNDPLHSMIKLRINGYIEPNE